MPRYRINYIARTIDAPGSDPESRAQYYNVVPSGRTQKHLYETEYQDEVEARNEAEALDAFFWQHVERREDVRIKGADGRSQPIEGVTEYDSAITYLWIEGREFMEYEGIEELPEGRVVCPMCNGEGEIDEALVDSYDELAAEHEIA